MWYVYIVLAADSTLYTGITLNTSRRIREHNSDNGRGSKYLRARRPVRLVYREACQTRSAASIREYEVKHLKKEEKLKLISSRHMK
jgi:putative endonuclease